MSEPSREGASFGKVLGLRLEVNDMDGLPLENDAACNTSGRAGTPSADILLRNRTPVGCRMQILLVEFNNGYVVRFAEACRTLGDNLQHGLECGRRSTDNLKNLRRGRLLFVRFVQFAAKPRDLSFPTSNGGTTTARSL
jgi:hypothetical protein